MKTISNSGRTRSVAKQRGSWDWTVAFWVCWILFVVFLGFAIAKSDKTQDDCECTCSGTKVVK